jgi:Dodecin
MARPNTKPTPKKEHMSMLKVIEVLAESEKSWEDAAQVAVVNASLQHPFDLYQLLSILGG